MPPRPAITEPYPGPRPFDKRERRIFFGRDEETTDVRDLVMSYQVVVLYSQSGAGKSSLVRAGIRPALIQSRVRVATARVGGDMCPPRADMQANLYVENTLASLMKSRVEMPHSLALGLAEKFNLNPNRQHRPSVVIFDQFEEFFTSHPERWRDRSGFFVQLREALNNNSELRALFVIREEHLAGLDGYSDLVPTSFRIRYRLERLKEEAAKAAILNPAKSFGYEIPTGEVDKLITNLRQIKVRAGTIIAEAEGEYIEPVHLQVVCHDVWRKRNEELKSLSFPDRVEDIDQSLATYYEHAIKRAATGMTREARLRSWFESELITPRGTRGFVYKGDRFTEGLPNKVIELLEQEHLVRSEPRGADSWYELTHDRLIAPIKRSNAQWLRKRRLQLWPLYSVASILVLFGLFALAIRLRDNYYRSKAADAILRGDGQMSRKNFPNAISAYKEATEDYRLGHDTGKHSEVFSSLGLAYMRTFNYDEAEKQFAKALSEAKDNDPNPSDHAMHGQALFAAGRTSDSIKEYKTALSLANDSKYDELQADTLRHLAEAQLRRGEFKDAMSSYEEVFKHVRSFEQMGEIFSDLFGTGLVLSQKGDYDGGLDLYNILLTLTGKLPGGQPPPRLLREIGYDQLHKGEFAEALENSTQAYQIAIKNQDVEQEASACLTLAEYYLEHSEQPQAQANDKLCAQSDLGCSLRFAEQANNDFHLLNDRIMEGATLTYKARVNISRALAHKKTGRTAESASEFEAAAKLLNEAYDTQHRSERRIGEAYALQAYGLLFDSEGDTKQAIRKYQESYCLYTSIEAADTHVHMREVASRIKYLGGQPEPCPPQTSD